MRRHTYGGEREEGGFSETRNCLTRRAATATLRLYIALYTNIYIYIHIDIYTYCTYVFGRAEIFSFYNPLREFVARPDVRRTRYACSRGTRERN